MSRVLVKLISVEMGVSPLKIGNRWVVWTMGLMCTTDIILYPSPL